MMMRTLLLSAVFLLSAGAHALSPEEVKGMALGETEARVEALAKASAVPDEKTAAFIQALADDAVKTAGDKVFVVNGDKAYDPITGAELALPPEAEDVINNNLMRGELDNALASLKLLSKDEKIRAEAIKTLSGGADESRLPLIEKAYAAETVPALNTTWTALGYKLRCLLFLNQSPPRMLGHGIHVGPSRQRPVHPIQ